MKINNIKRLYHGTNRKFDVFDFCFAKGFKDFGRGFYLTTNFHQAQKWAQNKAGSKTETYIYSYSIDVIDENEWKILELLQYNQEWVDFITQSRIMGKESEYDIIYDRMADSQFAKISETLQSYNDSKIIAERAIEKIKWNNYSADQYCFRNKRAVSLLTDKQVIVQYKDKLKIWRQVKE